MRCDYCERKSDDITKLKYRAKSSDGKRKQATFKICVSC